MGAWDHLGVVSSGMVVFGLKCADLNLVVFRGSAAAVFVVLLCLGCMCVELCAMLIVQSATMVMNAFMRSAVGEPDGPFLHSDKKGSLGRALNLTGQSVFGGRNHISLHQTPTETFLNATREMEDNSTVKKESGRRNKRTTILP
jgi:hypothetical protein